VKLTDIQEAMSAATMRILCIDACRDQPLPFTCSESKGAQPKKAHGFRSFTPEGMFVSFSTQPGNSAMDRSPNNPQYSPYALALVKAMEEGKEIKSIFTKVSRLVAPHGQIPIYYAGYAGDFYFSSDASVVEEPNIPTFPKTKFYSYSAGTAVGLTAVTVGTIIQSKTSNDWKAYYDQTPTDPENLYAGKRQKFLLNQRIAAAGGILALACGTLATREWLLYRKSQKKALTPSTTYLFPKISPEGLGFVVKF
jgi:hypothetical protein